MAFAVLHEMAKNLLFGMISSLVAKMSASLAGVSCFDSPNCPTFGVSGRAGSLPGLN
jgi:hypothetical protein